MRVVKYVVMPLIYLLYAAAGLLIIAMIASTSADAAGTDPKYQCLAWMSTYEFLHPQDKELGLAKAQLEFVMKLQNKYDASEMGDYVAEVDMSAGENSTITQAYRTHCLTVTEQYSELFGFTFSLKG